MKQQNLLSRQPTIKIVNAESIDITTTSTGKSTTLTIRFYLSSFLITSRSNNMMTLKNSFVLTFIQNQVYSTTYKVIAFFSLTAPRSTYSSFPPPSPTAQKKNRTVAIKTERYLCTIYKMVIVVEFTNKDEPKRLF